MERLFDIKCRNCGAPVSYDIVAQSYRCLLTDVIE